ncbi:TetR/AcrR family transcriptional regulator [Marinobacter changyiensis]|uniref:TetR/AcrR family transcriptional regulator n=1 Tax=Marinobacter changyiensis TaxID=2604091 RepID=UPI001264AC52|nr:TetR/AcrR family transcriptional regulator [Marinobacter changyiensis]
MTARQTQEGRSEQTQARIMQATLECILQKGIRATSTVDIAKQAGVSRGALVHHYPTKAILMEAAMEDLLDREVESFRETAKRVEEGTLEFETLLDILHEHFKGDLFMVTLEFLTAARTDKAAKEVLVPLATHFNESLEAIWEQLVSSEQHSAHENRVALNATLCMMRGMAAQSIWRDDPELYREMMLFWKQTLINSGFASRTNSSVRGHI